MSRRKCAIVVAIGIVSILHFASLGQFFMLSPKKTLGSEMIAPLLNLSESTMSHVETSSKPFVAVVMCATSKGIMSKNFSNMAWVQLMIPSLVSTIESDSYRYEVFVGVDDNDNFWMNPQNQQELQRRAGHLPVNVYGFPSKHRNHIPMNKILKVAYSLGADYLVRINDDSSFETSGWTTLGVNTLASYDPPYVGVVGPTCHEGNTKILTHDMVHKTHLVIFEDYYPAVFDNWWLDNWISSVYGTNRTTKHPGWLVKHHTRHHGTRYKVNHTKIVFLKDELAKGRKRVAAWLASANTSHLYTMGATTTKVMTTLEDVIVLITVSAGFDDMFSNWWAFYSKLNLSMAVVMIAEDKQTYNKYENIPGIEVWKSLCGNFTMAAEAFDYDTLLYKQLVSCRASHLMRTLEIHSKVIYSDIDTVWLGDPRPYLTGNFDLWAQLDATNFYCTGFMTFIRTPQILKFLEKWDKQLKDQPKLNQPLFNKILASAVDVQHKSLPRKEFPSGHLYFDQMKQNDVIIVHNNFIIGKDKKIQRFKDVGLWRPPKSLTQTATSHQRITEPPEGTQMGNEQIHEILSVLPKDGNLLVWGLGNDSPFWHNSTNGKVVFIEDDIPEKKAGTLWFDVITSKYPFLEAYMSTIQRTQ